MEVGKAQNEHKKIVRGSRQPRLCEPQEALKEDALDLAVFLYDIYQTARTRDIVKKGQNSANQNNKTD
jgi:predicted ATPase